MKIFVEAVDIKTREVEESIEVKDETEAREVARRLSVNLNKEDYYIRTVEQ